MKYADFENGRYEARLDRAKRNVEDYMHKNHVTYQDLGLPTKLGEMITEYAYTSIDERMAEDILDDDKHHNIMK